MTDTANDITVEKAIELLRRKELSFFYKDYDTTSAVIDMAIAALVTMVKWKFEYQPDEHWFYLTPEGEEELRLLYGYDDGDDCWDE